MRNKNSRHSTRQIKITQNSTNPLFESHSFILFLFQNLQGNPKNLYEPQSQPKNKQQLSTLYQPQYPTMAPQPTTLGENLSPVWGSTKRLLMIMIRESVRRENGDDPLFSFSFTVHQKVDVRCWGLDLLPETKPIWWNQDKKSLYVSVSYWEHHDMSFDQQKRTGK